MAITVTILLFIVDRLAETSSLTDLRAAIVLMRRLPPPHIVQTPSVLSILLPRPPREDLREISGIAFEHCGMAAVCLNETLVIVAVNKAFTDAFSVLANLIVGQPLTTIIPRPVADDGGLSPEDQAAFLLYAQLGATLQRGEDGASSYTTRCLRGEGFVTALVSVFAVKPLGFVLFIEDRCKVDEVRGRLEKEAALLAALEAQLMPVDLGSANLEEERSGTVVAVRIAAALKMTGTALEEAFCLVEELAQNRPPFFVFNVVFDTVYAVGGLFAKTDEMLPHAQTGFALAKSVAEEFTRWSIKFSIGIACGGRFLVSVAGEEHPRIEVAGPVVAQAADLVMLGAPNAITVSKEFADVIKAVPGVSLRRGPAVFGNQTFLA
jgi:PAS domain-containing protein